MIPAILVILFTAIVYGQCEFVEGDVTTFTDFRQVYSIDYNFHEVFCATEGGIWRFDRLDNTPLPPWHIGAGWDNPIPLEGGRLVLWHNNTSTLWYWTRSGLKSYVADIKQWYNVKLSTEGNILALGETPQYVVVALQDTPVIFLLINPNTRHIIDQTVDEPLDVRWIGGKKPNEFINYSINQHGLRFNSTTGEVSDREFNSYEPTFDIYDSRNQKRFIAYPGLGIGIGDERQWSMDIVQPGLAGKDVRAIEIVDGGFIWCGGENNFERTGLNLFDRTTGQWQFFNSDWIRGFESNNITDILAVGQHVYLATDEGLTVLTLKRGRKWQTLDRFSGMSGIILNAVSSSGADVYAGGRDGMDQIQFQGKEPSVINDEFTRKLYVLDLATESDTVWAVTMTGLYKISGKNWEKLSLSDLPALSNRINCLEVNKDKLWVGSSDGIGELDRHTSEWLQYPADVFFQGASPLCFSSNDSILWVGTEKGLFVKLQRKNLWNKLGLRHGLPSEYIQAVEMDADTLWVGTPEGLTKLIWHTTSRSFF